MGFNNENACAHQAPYLVFDIETVPMPGCEAFIDTDGISAPANYKDEAKIAAYIDAAKRKQIDAAGLDLDLCEVAALAFERPDRTGAVMLRAHMSEADMLRAFWRATGGHVLVGFNVLHFDLLVLLRRSLYLGVEAPRVNVDKYRHEGVIDLADTLSFGRRDLLRSLSFYAKRFGVAHDDSITGADIAGLVAAGDWAKVSRHVYDDVLTTHELALRLGVVSQVLAEAV